MRRHRQGAGNQTMRRATFRRAVARFAVGALIVPGVTVAGVGTASATGCTVPPCGAITNKTNERIGVKWADDDVHWQYGIVEPHTTKGGWGNDGLDIDFWYIPPDCTDSGGIGGDNQTWNGEQWAKIESYQTVVIDSRTCH